MLQTCFTPNQTIHPPISRTSPKTTLGLNACGPLISYIRPNPPSKSCTSIPLVSLKLQNRKSRSIKFTVGKREGQWVKIISGTSRILFAESACSTQCGGRFAKEAHSARCLFFSFSWLAKGGGFKRSLVKDRTRKFRAG